MAQPERSSAVGLDTSVVVRLLTGEPRRQAEKAFAFVEELRQSGRRAIVSDLVVAEAYFALHTHYAVPKRGAVEALLALLQSGVVCPDPDGSSTTALEAIAAGPATPGFVDRLIHAQYLRAAARVVSFERAFRKLPDTLVLKA